MQFVSGVIIAVGGLLLLGAIYMNFFDAPWQSTSQGDGTTAPAGGKAAPAPKKQAPRVVSPITITNIKPREALAPSLKMFSGNETPPAPQAKALTFEITGKSEFPADTDINDLPETQQFSGEVLANLKPATVFKINSRSQSPSFFPPETFATGIRLPEGLYIIPLSVIEFADFTTVFDGDEKFDVIPTRIIKKGNLRLFKTLKRPKFPRVISSDAGELNENTKGVSLIWVNRNAQIRILEDLDATGLDPESKEVTFDLPNDSAGGVIIDDQGRITAIVSDVKDGVGTARQMSTVLLNTERVTARDVLDFSRLPVSKDKAGQLREAAACLVQVHAKRQQITTHAAFESNIEASRGSDDSSSQSFDDRYEVNISDDGQITHTSEIRGSACRLPGFLGLPAMTSIIEFSPIPGKSQWKVEKNLKLSSEGNNLFLVPRTKDSNEFKHVTQTDEYRILEETPDYMTIERKYVAKSTSTQTGQESPIWDVPAGFPFNIEGKFTYRYDKALKLATSVVFEGVEQKQISKDLVVPLNLSFEMKSISDQADDESESQEN